MHSDKIGSYPLHQRTRLLPLLASVLLSASLCSTGNTASAESSEEKQEIQTKFSTNTWSKAVKSGADWSRVELAREFYKEFKPVGMDRKRVLELLGEPTLSTENSPQTKERTHLDHYILSAKNKESFRIDYDANNKVTSAVFEGPCQTWIYCPTGSVVKTETLNKLISSGQVNGTIKQIEAVLGKAHMQSLTKNPVGGQVWANYTFVWRLSPDGRKAFGVYGHKPFREYAKDRTVTETNMSSFIQTMSADCPHVSQPAGTLDDSPPLIESSRSSNAKR